MGLSLLLLAADDRRWSLMVDFKVPGALLHQLVILSC